MYDLTKDSEDYYLIRQLCISNQPILFYGVNIYQPLIKDLMRIKESDYLHIVNMFRFKDDIFDDKMNGLDYYLNLSLKNSIYSNYILLAFSIFFKVNINDINAEFDNSNRGNICINQNGNICIINRHNIGKCIISYNTYPATNIFSSRILACAADKLITKAPPYMTASNFPP